MKRIPETDGLIARKRFAAYRKEKQQTKLDLIRAAHAAEEAAGAWPEYLTPDADGDAWFHRKFVNSELIEKRGGFSSNVALLALTDSDWETKETVAAWLRKELKVLRDLEQKGGTAPVRRGEALSRLVIADVAIELLGCICGESLICLFQELLDIDRHRKSIAEAFVQLNNAAEAEAQLQLQGKDLGVRGFAKLFSVSPSTVSRWRQSPAFHERVNFHKHVWGLILKDEYFDEIRKDASELSEAECFKRAFQLYRHSIPLRREGKYRPKFLAGAARVLPQTKPVSRPRKSRRNSFSKSES